MGFVGVECSDPLIGGFYSANEAARLLRILDPRRVRGWLKGYNNSDAGPVLERDYEIIEGQIALSFWDLMEVRFLEFFRAQGIPLQTLRRIAVNARRDMKTKHPFAMSNVRFSTDRKKVFRETAKETGDKETLDLLDSQYEMYEVIEASLAKGMSFDPLSGIVARWQPLKSEFPSVIVDPHVAFGKPSIDAKHVPTSALFRTWKAEKGNISRVASWYRVTEADVKEAIEFELRMAA
jgi:uncharacterized protein (DUF433 family)